MHEAGNFRGLLISARIIPLKLYVASCCHAAAYIVTTALLFHFPTVQNTIG